MTTRSTGGRAKNLATGPGSQRLLSHFYTTARAGSTSLSDGGGPFGFDITVALQVDYLINSLDCDGIVETGCHLGDTTEFLARHYDGLSVTTCDIDASMGKFTRLRCAELTNLQVMIGDSAELLPEMMSGLRNPLIILDAHWYDPWPLPVELETVARLGAGVVCVDDFYIGHPRFGFDEYARRCDAELVAEFMPDQTRMFIGNPYGQYSFPCLQVGRRAGVGYVMAGLDTQVVEASSMFCAVELASLVTLPDWASPSSPEA